MAAHSQHTLASFDEDGYLIDLNYWDETLAITIANAIGIKKLSQSHWEVISAMRQYFNIYGVFPTMHYLCHTNKFSRAEVDTLFSNHCTNAWKIAGLPNPGEEAKAYL